MVVVEWATAVSLFWVVAALFLGGAPIRIRGGGGVRQTLGLLLALALYLAAWNGVVAGLDAMVARGFAVAAGTLLSGLLVPAFSWIAFRPLGVRIERGAGGH